MHRSQDIEAGAVPPRVYTVAEAREVDRRCVEEYGIPSILLMEHAAIGVRDVALRVARDGPVLVLVGPGNNGGDGLAVARLLHERGRAVTCVLSCDPGRFKPGSDAAVNLRIVLRLGLPLVVAEGDSGATMDQACASIGPPRLIVDALLGTGLDRPASGVIAGLIGETNRRRSAGDVCVLAIDVPSGLDADRGEPPVDPAGRAGAAIHADVTVSLMGLKAGYLTLAAQTFVGDCFVASIGAPPRLLESLGRPGPSVCHGDGRDGPMQSPTASGAADPASPGRARG
jgi:NAD(P)H-hydrate epimerase